MPLKLFRQFMAVFTLTLRRTARSRFFLLILLASLGPVALVITAVTPIGGIPEGEGEGHKILEFLLRVIFIHFLAFFSAILSGFIVMRQEEDDQTLHYLYMRPVPRWLIAPAKLAGVLVVNAAPILISYWVCYLVLILFLPESPALLEDLFTKGQALILIKESLVILLALTAYGALAMILGSFCRSIGWALLILGWETALPYLPSSLKLWTVMYYLQSLLPEYTPERDRLFELIGERPSALTSLLTLVLISAGLITLCAWIFRTRECVYKEG